MRIETPPQFDSSDQHNESYQSHPIIPRNITNPNPQGIIQSYMPPNTSQTKVHINFLPQFIPYSSKFILPTYVQYQNPNPTQAYVDS